MAVCFVATDSTSDDGDDNLQIEEDSQENHEVTFTISQFWEKAMEDIRKTTVDDFKQQALPLARIKRIMKLDEDVRMISGEAPLLFAKAAEIFIHELTLRAWIHTEENKRRTLQKNDIGSAAAKSDQYDFLIDILPPDELRHSKPKEDTTTRRTVPQDQVQYYLQLAQQHQAALQQPQPVSTQIQTQNAQATSNTPQIVQVTAATTQQQQSQQQSQPPQQQQQQQQPQQQQTFQLVQQVVTPNGEIQQIPIHLTPAQFNLIRMQMQSGSNQPIIIQAAPINHNQPQIIQVNPQQQPPHPVYLTQVVQEGEILS